jgi:hypothetical protein
MIVIKQDGTLARFTATEGHAGTTKDAIDLSIDLVEQQSDLLDRVVAFAFDVLGLQTVELRIRPAEGDTLPESAKNDS